MTADPFFDISLDLLVVAAPDGRFVRANRMWEKVLGWTPEEMCSRPYVEFVHPDDREATVREKESLADGLQTLQFENRYRRKDGGYVWLQWNALPVVETGLIYGAARDVSRAKRLSTTLRNVERSTGVGGWEIDLQTNDLYWTESIHLIHETDPATYYPKLADGLTFYPPEAQALLVPAVEALMEKGTPYRLELPFVSAKGRLGWIRTEARGEWADGRLIRVYGTFEDITLEREEREGLLAFKDIVDLASDGICVTNEAGHATYANARMELILGLAPGGMIGRRFMSHVEPESVGIAQQMLAHDPVAGGVRQDFRMVRADGSAVWVSASLRVRPAADGKPGSTVALVRDISERKRIELELEASRTRLEEAQTIAQLGHWEANLTTGAMFWSDVMYDIFGIEKGGLPPSLDWFETALHPDDHVAADMAQRQSADGAYDIEHRIVRPDGSMRWVHRISRLDRDRWGHPVRMLGTLQDITRQKEAEAAMSRAHVAAEQASRAKSTFLATMSHELRTPLNAILGFTEIIKDGHFGAVVPSIYGEYASHVHGSATHLLDIINDVLDLAKVESEGMLLRKEYLDVGEKLRRAVSTVQPLGDQQGVAVTIAVEEGTPQIQADRRAMLQVLFNILSNAIRHSPRSSTVDISVATDEGRVRIDIRDQGPGFPADVLYELGKPFPGQLDSYRGNARSSGLGFAITASLMKAMGGTVEAHNPENGGAVVRLVLPAAHRATAAQRTNSILAQ